MVILATYGYKQSQVFNINCKVAPLLELIRRTSYSDIYKLLQTRQDQLINEITDITVKLEAKERKLGRLENPPPPPEETKEPQQENVTKKKSVSEIKRVPKSSHALAEAKKAEEERKKAEEAKKKEEEAKKAEEERKKAEEAAKKKKEETKKGKKEEVKELTPEEIKQQQIENHKNDLRKAITDFSTRKQKLQEKLDMIKSSLESMISMPKEIDLVDQNNVRKFLSTRDEENASKILNTRSVYGVVVIENDTYNPYEINGFCIRSIEEDANYVEDVDAKKNKAKVQKKK
ncbi:hypothetical protein SteCoe_10573 [Stentor coeruleus]|uniref:Uncharacterized protein n=1 Tax=Stentor coeruleus TaxID=5963 RepID=A0A1R2CF51_9CILI|nr:hypothetical protein SteCoe_10573 [Stentor coeruleus]